MVEFVLLALFSFVLGFWTTCLSKKSNIVSVLSKLCYWRNNFDPI